MPLLKGTAGKAMPDMAIGYITRKDKAKYIDVQNLFEDEDYLQLQLNAIRTSLRAFIAMKTGSENWKAGGAHE